MESWWMMQKKIIYEEDAIKAIWDALYDYKGEYDERSSYGVLCNAEEKLMALQPAQPEVLAHGEGELSAQPEIIRCKDCKHYKAYDYTGYLSCHLVVGRTVRRDSDDFCSRAERRTYESD